MRVKEMHPLCCISLESPAMGDQSPETRIKLSRSCSVADMRSDGIAAGLMRCGSESCAGSPSFAGVLYKWTNYGKGWRSRWFLLRNGVLSYSKILQLETLAGGEDVRLIGDVSSGRHKRLDRCGSSRRHKNQKTVGIVHLKVLSFRESRSDDRRFYIFTGTKTLDLRTSSKKDRASWIECLGSTRNPLNLRRLNEILLSTERLKKRLVEEGSSEVLVKDCEQIILLEFSQVKRQVQLLCEELDTLRQLEAANIEGESSGGPEQEFTDRGKYRTESSDDVSKEEGSEDEYLFDASDSFPMGEVISRRKKLPDPCEEEKGVSLWSVIKENVGKDLTRVCLPVYFNEPISSLQKCFEDLEYSYLLDRAYEHGRGVERTLNVGAFAVSGYASSQGRHCKPFNPLLGETYEADYPEKGVRFFSEKVSHHPTLIACHSEGKGWKFWGDSNITTKFWGRSIQVDPVGLLTLQFDDGEVFQWSKVTTSIYNLILGKVYCDHHGMMHIHGNGEYSSSNNSPFAAGRCMALFNMLTGKNRQHCLGNGMRACITITWEIQIFFLLISLDTISLLLPSHSMS